MIRAIVITILAAGLLTPVYTQGIRGEIRDQNGDPVPYAAIFIKELTRGTTCNALGQYSLPLPTGTYTIFFRSMGYTEVNKTVEVGDEFEYIVVELPPQTYMIPEVRVSASGEDPAYWIMRKVIGLANYHLNEVSSYNAEIYIKGTAYIDNLPRAIARRIEVNDFQVEEKQAYMLESLNEVQFKAPDTYEMRVIASQNTLPGYTDNVNPMDYINASLYQQQIETVVSPLARNAFSYYRFQFENTFMEGTYVINKIKVIPKRKSQQLCRGFLYIVEDLWCLHSSDLEVETIAGTLYLKQLYANVMMDAWLPVNHNIKAEVDIAGVKGDVTYVSSLKYSDVTLNPNLPEIYFSSQQEPVKDEETPEETASREQEKILEILEKEELTNRDVNRLSRLMEKEAENALPEETSDDLNQTGTTFTVAENAVKNDSLFWNRVRPIPLTPEEHLTIRERDSIMGPRLLSANQDTVKTVSRNRTSFRDVMFGNRYYRNQGRVRISHGGLLDLDMLGYNTVDGLYYGQYLGLEWRPDSIHALRSTLRAGYAIHRNAPMVDWNINLLYAPMARGKVQLSAWYTSSDFNGKTGIPATTNLAYTLVMRENYLKKYEQLELELYNQLTITNGMQLITTANMGRKSGLENNSTFSLFYRNSKDFSPNLPGSLNQDDPALAENRFFSLFAQVSYTPRQYYIIRNYRKVPTTSEWPTLRIAYRQAIPLQAAGWSQYARLEAGISHQLEVGLLSELTWSLGGGYYLDRSSIHFSDFKHFKSGPLLIDMADFEDALMLMDYYEASTAEYWYMANARLTSSYLLLKFLPWFSERLWKEAVVLDYLHTPATPHYLQLGYNLSEIFFLVDLGVYAGFQEGRYKGFGARINFRF
jgi:hypothetical protein